MKTLSPFAQLASDLDQDFSEFHHLRRELEKLEVESDFGIERARKLLGRFGECGERIGSRVQELAQTLSAARCEAEESAGVVAKKAQEIQAHMQTGQELQERLQQLGEKARLLVEQMGDFPTDEASLTDDTKAMWLGRLPALDASLGELSQEALNLKEDAQAAQRKTLEDAALSMRKSLVAARKRLRSLQPDATAG